MSHTIRTLVALDEGVNHEAVQASLPVDSDIQIVGIVDGLEDSWTTQQETPADLLIVACAGYSDRALYLIDGAVKQRPDRPVVVLATGSPNGFVSRVFEAGADDIVTLSEPPDRIAFALEKAFARRRGAAVASGIALTLLIHVVGPKCATGKTHVST